VKHSSTGARTLAQGDYETLAQFRYLLRRFGAFSQEAARAAGLSAQQHQALLAIKGFPGGGELSIGELAERLNSRHHRVVGLAHRLAARGLIARRRDRADRRRVLVRLTPRAQALLLRLSLAHKDELRRLAPLLQELLRKLAAAG